MSFIIDRHPFSEFNVKLEVNKQYVRYDEVNDEITFTSQQLYRLLFNTYEDGKLGR